MSSTIENASASAEAVENQNTADTKETSSKSGKGRGNRSRRNGGRRRRGGRKNGAEKNGGDGSATEEGTKSNRGGRRGGRGRRGRRRRGGRNPRYQRREKRNYAKIAADALKEFISDLEGKDSAVQLLKVTNFPEGISKFRDVRRQINMRLEGAGVREKDGYHPKFEITGSAEENNYSAYLLLNSTENVDLAKTALTDGKEGSEEPQHAFNVEEVDTIEETAPVDFFKKRLTEAMEKAAAEEAAAAAEKQKLAEEEASTDDKAPQDDSTAVETEQTEQSEVKGKDADA
eukprot:g1509.t1